MRPRAEQRPQQQPTQSPPSHNHIGMPAAAKVGHEVEQLRVLLGEREEGAAQLSSQLRAATRGAARQGASTSLSGCVTAQAAHRLVPYFCLINCVQLKI